MGTVVSGLAVGCIYALLACGYALIFKVSRSLNLALGAFLLLGGYLAYQLGTAGAGLPFVIAVAISCGLVAVLAFVVYRTVAWPLIRAHPDALVIATIGVDLTVRSLLSSNDHWSLNVLDVGLPGTGQISAGGDTVASADIVIIGVTAAVGLILAAVFRWSNFGLSMRACAEDGEVALAQGISIRRNLAVAWIIAAALTALVGILVGASPRNLDMSNYAWAFRALPAAVLGGIGSLRGAFVGGITVGYIEVLALIYQPPFLGSGFYLIVPYAAMLVVLLIRPQGLFGVRKVARA
ncbi:branched-chain amino acid ABC transporter permease [Pseudonocardia sp. GCM10023141]|uniref:branched-chain amino acid ABC transporter permease n=1 Tax=Pseudonocardia sp. GCM10023141 TaxID=3252653 RepID=UPI00361A569D